MHEEVLKRFFLGEVSAKVLADGLAGSLVERRDVTYYQIKDMSGDFEVQPEHLVRVCDTILNGDIEAKYLEAIGFCIVASDHYEYDTDTPEGGLVGETVFDWCEPRANYPLTIENVRRFRERLITGGNPFTAEGAG